MPAEATDLTAALSTALADLAEARIALAKAEDDLFKAEERTRVAEKVNERELAETEGRLYAAEDLLALALRVLEDADITETDLLHVRASVDPVGALKRAREPRAPRPPPIPQPPPIPKAPPIPVAPDIQKADNRSFSWTAEQEDALAEVGNWLDGDVPFFSLTGPAGAGKSTMAKEIVERHFGGSALAAMTGKAALRLSQLTGRTATTLHSILYYPPAHGADLRFTRLREPPANLVLVDESSQMTPAVKEDMMAWAIKGVKFLLLGDDFQLPPVITGKELEKWGDDYSVFSHCEGAALQTVMRNAGGVLRAATLVRERGEICERSFLDGVEEGYEFLRCADPLERAVEAYLEDPSSSFLVTWRNAMRMKANAIVRERLGFTGPLPDEGEGVVLKRNGAGFLNGEIVICRGFDEGPKIGSMKTLWMKVGEGFSEQKILVSFEGGRDGEPMDGGLPWVTDYKRFHSDLQREKLPEPCPISWAHCLSGHGVQGSQAKRAIVFLAAGDDRNRAMRRETMLPDGSRAPFIARWCYTAQTRAERYTKMLVGR